MCPVSAITQEPNENPAVFLERLKEAPPKFTNLDLDSYERHVILKDKFLSQHASDIRIKLQLQQQDPLPLQMRWSRQLPITFIVKSRRGRPRPRKGRKGKRQGMPRC